MSGHGHVVPNADGSLARCGGPGICSECALEQARLVGQGVFGQRPPKPGTAPATWDLVLADIAARDRMGAAKYGVRHQSDNGRDHLRDAYEEALDLVVYLRAEIHRRDGR